MPAVTQTPPRSSPPGPYVDPKLEKYNARLTRKRDKILRLQKRISLVVNRRASPQGLSWWVRVRVWFQF
jgi:hypothetical protein